MVSKEESFQLDSDEEIAKFGQIEQAVSDVGFGSVTLIVQDGKIIQIEKLDKIRVEGHQSVISRAAKTNSILRSKIIEAMDKMNYGQVMIVIKNKRIVQIERTEKQRVHSLEGLYGDGI